MDSGKDIVTKKELLIELDNELHYHSNGGTRYRRETTELAIVVANQIHDVTVFFDRKKAYDTVAETQIIQDEYQLQDVTRRRKSFCGCKNERFQELEIQMNSRA